jgi:hypothetical protein
MSHRSVLRCALGTLAALLLLATPASAATMPVPADAPTVATAPADGTVVIAWRRDDEQLCVVVQTPGDPRPERIKIEGNPFSRENGRCTALPVLAPFGDQLLITGVRSGTRTLAVGVTGTSVAAVEAKRDGKVVARAETVASPLPVAAADLRFYLTDVAPDADEVALLDAGGTVRRARTPSDDPVAGGAVPRSTTGPVVAEGRRAGHAWALGVPSQRRLAPTPLLPEHWVTVRCLAFTGARDARTCDDEALARSPVVIAARGGCGAVDAHVAVLARTAVRRVEVVLGDGRRRTIPLRVVPGDRDGLRAGVVVLGPGVAVRRLVVSGAGGRVLMVNRLRQAPGPGPAAPCPAYKSFRSQVRYGRLGIALHGPTPHVFRAVDDGVRLCLAADRAPRVPQECDLPPADLDGVALSIEQQGATATAWGLVTADVATARLMLDDRTTRDVPAAPIPGYAGQYSATTPLVAATIAAPRHVLGYQLLDARGRLLEQFDGWREPARPGDVTTVLRSPGLPALRAGFFGPIPCLALGPLTKLNNCAVAVPGVYRVKALCTPRRIVIWGLLRYPPDNLIAETAGGREITALKAILPIRYGRGRTAALLVIPADTAVRRLILRARAAGRADLVLPPAAEQCGYDDYAWVTNAFAPG